MKGKSITNSNVLVILRIATFLLAVCLLFSYRGLSQAKASIPKAGAQSGKSSAHHEKRRTESHPFYFENIQPHSGVNFVLRNSVSPNRYSIETMLGGVALFDYNNDGLLDIFLTNGAAIPSLQKSGEQYWNRLYRNNGDGTFTDVTEKAGLAGIGYSMGVAAADYDNDGYVDLYVTGYNRNQLFHNNGDGTFTDVTDKAGVSGIIPGVGKPWGQTAGWFDYNNDGRLDLLVINYLDYHIKTAAHCEQNGLPAYCTPLSFKGTPNILYRNNGDGTFTDVSKESHIAEFVGKGMGVSFADYDNDGFTDVFISNDTFPNFLLHNNGNGTFSEVALQAAVAYNGFGSVVAGMGTDSRDIDDDGKPDIFQTAMFGEGYPVYRNLGNGEFLDMSGASRLAAQTTRVTAWGAGVFDFDNDGRKDLFTANSDILDNSMEIAHRPFKLPAGIFRNKGNFTFEDESRFAGADFSVPEAHRGAAFGDLNNDGKIDIVVTDLNSPPQILMNRSRNTHHWILLNLIGTKSNRDGLGTKVKITTTLGVQYNHATTTVGYNSSSDKRVHFGLGAADKIQSIELIWPSGIHQTLKDVKVDQVLTVKENAP